MAQESKLNRRTFLTGTIAAGALASTGRVAKGAPSTSKADAQPPKKISNPGKIPSRPFGSTGYTLPVLGHGGSAMVQSWAIAYGVKLESQEARTEMVRMAYDQGIRFFDTARVYSESESVMGTGLADVRDDVFIASKVADPRPDYTRQSVETSLEQLQTDYIDLMQIHSPAIERVGYDGGMKIYEQLAKLREEGLIHFIGLTTHVAFEDVFRMVDTGNFDQVLLARGYFRKGMDMMLSNKNIEWREQCVARAHELGMAIVTMKVMGLNVLGRGSKNVVADYDPEQRKKIPAAAIRWVMQDERISMLNIGVSLPDDIKENVATMTGDLTFTDDDRLLLADYTSKAYESRYVQALKVV